MIYAQLQPALSHSEVRTVKLEPANGCYNSWAFERSEPRHPAPLLLPVPGGKLGPAHISHSALGTTCEKGDGRRRAPALLRKMRAATVARERGPTAPGSYRIQNTARENGQPRQPALSLVSEMRAAKLGPTVSTSRSIPISACEHCEQWRPALPLLSEMRAVKIC